MFVVEQVMPKAVCCIISKAHQPMPLRFVWHHVQPSEAGGPNTPANQVQLCDSCHYTIHRLLWLLAQNRPLPTGVRRAQIKIATAGYQACVIAGTVDKIPNEG